MEKRRIGSLEVGLVGLGCNNFGRRLDYRATERVVRAALDAGINLFDTADIYGGTRSEEYLGRALAGRRAEAVIATKFGMAVDAQKRGARPEYVRGAVEESLGRLDTDRIDLYQLHQPDPEVPIGDTLAALGELVREGKVREIGCSNFSAQQLQEAKAAAGDVAFASVQNEYSLLHREPEREVLPYCKANGMAFLPFFPLASGLLTGKYRRGELPPPGTRLSEPDAAEHWRTERNLTLAEALTAYATGRGHSLLELAFSWLASRPQVSSVIAGATSPEQLTANLAAVGWKLKAEELAEIDRLAPPS